MQPGETVAVIGAGMIGLCLIKVLKAAGAKKIFIAAKNSVVRIKAAKELGPEAVINVEEADPVKTILELNGGQKVDVVFEVSGNPVVIPQAVEYVRKGGEIVVVGSPPKVNVEIPLLMMVRNEISLIAVQGRTHSSWVRAINLVGRVNVAPILGPIVPLDDIEDAFRKCMNGEVIKLFIKPN